MIVCSHFTKIKQDKIPNLANAVKRVHFCQSHPASIPQDPKSQEIWICLDCGNQACSKYSQSGCALKHSVEQRHRLAIGLKRLMVFCFECDHDLQSSIDEQAAEDIELSPPAVKLQSFIDKVKQLFFKLQQQITAGQPQNNQETLEEKNNKPKANLNVNSVKPLQQIPSNIFGLVNLGNTCFFNSVIQCLNGCRELINEYNLQDFQGLIEMHEEIQNSKSKNQVEDEDDGWVSSNNKKKNTKLIDQQQFMKNNNTNSFELPPKMINQLFQRLISESRMNSTKIFNPSALFTAISQLFGRFKTLQQQDAHDLLRCLLDGLIVGEEKWHNVKKISEKKQGKLKNTITENIFGGYLSNYLKCLECNHVSRTFEFFLDLALPIVSKKSQPPKKIQMLDILGTNEEDIEKEKDSVKMQEKGKQDNQFGGQQKIAYQKIPMIELDGCKIPYFNRENESLFEPVDTQQLENNGVAQQNPKQLTGLLKDFFSLEQLTKQTNYYRCEKCGQSSRAERKFFLHENPHVLTFVLKRFLQTSANRFEKVNTHVEISESISVAPYTLVKNPDQTSTDQSRPNGQVKTTYELFGVIVHEGSMLQGHYVAFVKHIINGESHWFYYSDEHFYETTWENVKASQAYILFFRKATL